VVGPQDDRQPEVCAVSPPAPARVSLPPPPLRKRSSFGGPALQAVAAAVLLIGIGGFYVTQRKAASPPPVTSAIVVPTAASRVLTTVSNEAAACQERSAPFEVAIPDAGRLALSHAGIVPGIEMQPVAKRGDVGVRNVRFDVKTGKLSGEIYAKGGCASPQSAVASYKVVAFYNSP
jgi:hypothetical protein